MNNLRRSVGLPVYFLSVVCALLIGFIAGHFLPEHRATEDRANLDNKLDSRNHQFKTAGLLAENTVRYDILHFGPDMENIWRRNLTEIPTGNTRIQGRVLLNGKPMEGLRLALLFAPGRKTEVVTTNTNGEYEISLPEDQYILYAILCYNQEHELTDKICVNKLEDWSQLFSLAAIGKLFREGTSTLDATSFNRRTDKKTPALMPDINYRDPVQIVSPVSASHEKLGQVRFSWIPYPGATSYIVEISSVTKEGDTTTYIPVMLSKVQKDSVDYAELFRTSLRNRFLGNENGMEENKSYTIQVMALGPKGEIISASSDNTVNGIIFHID
jgi:hypothetical protein